MEYLGEERKLIKRKIEDAIFDNENNHNIKSGLMRAVVRTLIDEYPHLLNSDENGILDLEDLDKAIRQLQENESYLFKEKATANNTRSQINKNSTTTHEDDNGLLKSKEKILAFMRSPKNGSYINFEKKGEK